MKYDCYNGAIVFYWQLELQWYSSTYMVSVLCVQSKSCCLPHNQRVLTIVGNHAFN